MVIIMTSSNSDDILKNDFVILSDTNKPGNKILIRIASSSSAAPKKISALGVYNTGKLIGKKYGTTIELGRRKYLLLRPAILDILDTLQRKAQIITPKDSGVILLHCNIKSGDTIVEGGLGSGALTLVLVNQIRPTGKVIAYEKASTNLETGMSNLKNAGFEEYVVIKHQDITKGIGEKSVDAVILDIPEPWEVVLHAHKALTPGGHFASYSPTINQVEKTVGELKRCNFTEPYTIETLQRQIVVGDGGTRPSFDMLGHTGYLTFARKIEEK